MRARTRLALDAALLVAFIAAYRPAWTGLTVHQWLSIVIIAPLLVHGVVNWEWTLRIARTFFQRLMSMSRLNLVIDAALFVSAVCVMVSGVMVSPMLLAMLGVHGVQSPVWHAVHAWSANATIAGLAVHGVVHWRWLYRTAAKLVGPPAPRVGARVGAKAGVRAALLAGAAQASALTAVAPRTSHVGRRAAQAATERTMALRAISVAGVTGLVGLTVFVGVSVASPSLAGARNATTKVAATGGTVCPVTGCTASRCHGEYGQSAKEFYAASKSKPRSRRKPASASSTRRVALAASSSRAATPKKTPAAATHAAAAKHVASAPVAKPKPQPVKVVHVAAAKPKVHKQTCPQTGCTASSCHGAHGVSASSWYKTH